MFKKSQLQLNQTVTLILIVGVVITVNYLLTLFPIRLDVTANQRFSLSKASKELVRNIDDLVTIKVFVSQKLPAQFSPTVQQVRDLLWEYQSSAPNKLKVEYFDPSADDGAAQKANSLGIYPIQFSDISQEKLEVSQGYFGLAIIYVDRSETLSFIEDTSNLEYQISLAITSLTREEKPMLVFITGHDEKSITEDLASTAAALRQLYTVQESSLEDWASDEELRGKTTALIIVDPQKELSDKEKFQLDQFLMKGKSVLALLEGANVEAGLQAAPTEHKLGEFFGHYGAAINNDLILDTVNELANFSDGRSSFFVAYPFWPKVTGNGLSADSVITNRLENILFPWSSSVTVQVPEGISAITLAQTSSRSWTQKDTFDLDPTQEFSVPKEVSPQTLAVLLEGAFNSYFKGKDLPEDASSDDYKQQGASARLIVVGDASFAQERFVRGQQGNYVFLANMIDYLAAETGLTEIRAKGQTFRPIKEISSAVKQQVKYANILGAPIGLLVFGFVKVYRRKE
ncbi:GldG family protein [Patescibacteria group bacterium]|nr:GldG family protein [Patescibacteria group bacterium]